jgi:hypothetical protein
MESRRADCKTRAQLVDPLGPRRGALGCRAARNAKPKPVVKAAASAHRPFVQLQHARWTATNRTKKKRP